MLGGQTLGGSSQLPRPNGPHRLSNGGNLGLGFAHKEQSRISHVLLFAEFSVTFRPPASSSRLSDLKRRAFAPSGRAERISKSLAAVDAAQPTRLSPSEWKWVAEADIEDQY
jgi:hypothetical protein